MDSRLHPLRVAVGSAPSSSSSKDQAQNLSGRKLAKPDLGVKRGSGMCPLFVHVRLTGFVGPARFGPVLCGRPGTAPQFTGTSRRSSLYTARISHSTLNADLRTDASRARVDQ